MPRFSPIVSSRGFNLATFGKGFMLFCLIATTQNAYAKHDDKKTRISVMASAESVLPSEEVTISGSIITAGADAKHATAENAKILEKIRQFWQKENMPKEDLSTVVYRVTPIIDYKENNKANKISGFEVTHDLRFVFPAKKDVGHYIDGLVQAGLNTINNVSFSAKASDKIYEDLTKQALEDAKKKATAIMTQMHGKNLQLRQISLDNNNPPVVMDMAPTMMRAGKAMAAPTQIMDNGQTITVRIPTAWTFEQE